eukprot:scaffold11008_cov171-Skeletonema_dohrnii-CCMP3373.AAC.4
MKLATAVISLVTIIGANGTSTASTKSSKSKSKASCIESKSGKALSLSSKSGKASWDCLPCSFGSGILLNTTLCGTDAGFCEFRGEDFPPIVDACDANSRLVSADAEPTCVFAECVPRGIEPGCGLCATAPSEYDCPVVDGFCQVDLLATGYDCAPCNETACPDLTFDQCQCAPPEDEKVGDGRKDDDILSSRDVVEVMRLKTRRTCVGEKCFHAWPWHIAFIFHITTSQASLPSAKKPTPKHA